VRGEGPTFIEAVTYRRLGHSSSDDPGRYRDEAEVKAWEARDPVERLRRHLERRRLWDTKAEGELQEQIAQEVNAAIAAAEAGQPVAGETLIEDVFAEPTPQLREQLREIS
jgi:pyruvate dehydrogenase E1 component alpha subunit